MYKYTPIYSDGGKPELFEDDVLKISIPLNVEAANEADEKIDFLKEKKLCLI